MKKSRAEIAIREEIERTDKEVADIEKQIDALQLKITIARNLRGKLVHIVGDDDDK